MVKVTYIKINKH